LSTGRLYAISDLHVAYAENRQIVEGLRPVSDDDWLIVAGDVGELFADIEWALSLLSRRFAKVIWTPGNHELWTPRRDPMPARGVARYEALVRMCQTIGVTTPEDAYPVWRGIGGPALVVPLFLLYDYSFRAPGTHTKEESLRRAYDAGVVCTDEVLLFPDPYPTRDDWCSARLAVTEQLLAARDPLLPTVLVNHYPLIREPTRVLHFPEFAQWCGTERTEDWHRRFNAVTMIYGHLHIPRVTWHDGVCFREVSVGYPREWSRRPARPWLRPVLPVTPAQPRPDIGRTHTGRQ